MSTATEQLEPTVDAPPAEASSVVLDAETRFQQSYRVDSPVNAGSTVEAVRNGAGDVELFTLGTDGTIWNFYPDPASESGYSGVSTGVTASTFGVGRGADGHIVLFAAYRLQLSYVVESPSATARWSSPTQLAYTPPKNASMIARVLVDDIGGQLYVAALVEYVSAGNTLYSLVYSAWNAGDLQLETTSMNVSSTNCMWTGSSAATAAFACVDVVIVAYGIATRTIRRYPMTGTFHSLSVDAAEDSAGNTQIVAVLADGNAYHLIGGSGTTPYSWQQLSSGMNFRQIGADADDAGAVHVFGVSGSNRLYHWEPTDGTPSGYDDPAPIAVNVAAVGLAADDGGDIDVFAIGTAQSTLTHVFQEEESTNWVEQAVEVPTAGQVDQYISYSSDVAVYDATGALLSNAPVVISATEQTRVSVNGQVYFAGPSHPITTSTNGAGLLTIAQETGSLAIPALTVHVAGVMPPGEVVAIKQADVTKAQLAAVTGPDLMTATNADGDYVLADQYRTQQTTDSLASAFQQCMKLAEGPLGMRPLRGRHRTNVGVGVLDAGRVGDLRHVRVPRAEQHWRLSFADGGVRYEELSADGAAALIAEWRASMPSVTGVFDWIDDVGDFLAGVVDGIIDVVDYVVTTVADGVKAVIQCVIDGVNYVFEAIVDTIEQAFDFVETVLAKVQVFFEDVFKWLGFLFDWPDMLRTHEALAYTLNEFLTFLQGAAAGTQRLIDSGIATLQSDIRQIFDEAVAQIAGQSSLGGYEQTNREPSPMVSGAAANNPIYTGTIDNAFAASSLAIYARPRLGDADSLMQQLTSYADDAVGSSAFEQAWSYFSNLGGSADEIFSQLLAGLMRLAEGVLQAILAGAQAVIDALLGAVQTVIASIQSMLNESWDIPLVSDLYSWITDGSELTTLDLIALMAAVPTTIVYKALYDDAPFRDESSVDAFKSSFNAQTMLQAAGLQPATAELAAAQPSGLSEPVQRLLLVGSGVSTMFYGGFTAVANAWPPPASPPALSKVNLALEAMTTVCSFPWFFSSAAPSCNDAEGRQAVLWLYSTTGVMLDGFYVYIEDRKPPNFDDTGVIVSFVWSLGHLAATIAACVGQSGLPVASNVLPVIAELAVPLRHTKIITATEGISLPVLGAIDAVFYVTTGVITAVTPLSGSTLELRGAK
jgi:hypothetical protein